MADTLSFNAKVDMVDFFKYNLRLGTPRNGTLRVDHEPGTFSFCSLTNGPLFRVRFGESLVVRLYSEIDHLHLIIEAQCVSHLLPLGDCHTYCIISFSDGCITWVVLWLLFCRSAPSTFPATWSTFKGPFRGVPSR